MNRLIATVIILTSIITEGIGDPIYKREIKEISDLWHIIDIPVDMFGKTSKNFYDIRILGVTSSNDTIEAPYILEYNHDKLIVEQISCKTIDRSKKDGDSFFTFKNSAEKELNSIDLQFEETNFDWRVDLEGSHDQKNWFSIITDYRIVSINSSDISFNYSTLNCPESSYRYFRAAVKGDGDKNLKSVNLSKQIIEKGRDREFSIDNIDISKKSSKTVIDIKMGRSVFANSLAIDVEDKFDYYRPIKIKTISDSSLVNSEWRYRYKTLFSGTLSSLKSNNFIFDNSLFNRLIVDIENGNNQPIKIDNLSIRGTVPTLTVRFTETAKYFITYGDRYRAKPHYDIEMFTDRIPEKIKSVKLGIEETVSVDKPAEEVDPIFKNRIWIWVIMIVVIALIGWFSFKMIKEKEEI